MSLTQLVIINLLFALSSFHVDKEVQDLLEDAYAFCSSFTAHNFVVGTPDL